MVWTFLCAETAIVAGCHVLLNLQHLKLRSCMKNLEQVSCDAESSEKHCPRDVRSENVSDIVCSEKHADPQPELHRVGNRSERTEVTAPEHVDDEAAKNHNTDRYDGHPEGDLALESCRDCIIWVDVLAEKFAGLHSHVENPEKQSIFHDAEHLVEDGSVADLYRLDVHCVASLADEVLHSAQRTDICAEKLAEQHDGCQQGDAHHHLERRHAARQAVVRQVCRKCLKTAHRAICFRVYSFFRRDEACDEHYKGDKHSPLEEVLRPV